MTALCAKNNVIKRIRVITPLNVLMEIPHCAVQFASNYRNSSPSPRALLESTLFLYLFFTSRRGVREAQKRSRIALLQGEG
jgi:hypothetical protein